MNPGIITMKGSYKIIKYLEHIVKFLLSETIPHGLVYPWLDYMKSGWMEGQRKEQTS